jgi:hypothetical protein
MKNPPRMSSFVAENLTGLLQEDHEPQSATEQRFSKPFEAISQVRENQANPPASQALATLFHLTRFHAF